MKADRSGAERLEQADELCGLLASGSFRVCACVQFICLSFKSSFLKTFVHSFVSTAKNSIVHTASRLHAGCDSVD